VIVIDSSVFASVVVKDEFYDRCRLYVARGDKATVDIAYAEVANVVWKHVKMGRIPPGEAAYRVRLASKIISSARVYRSVDLLEEAVEAAVRHGVAVYDALYLTLAVKLGAKLATTDRSLAERLGAQAISYIELL